MKIDDLLFQLAKPAQRALQNENINSIEKLITYSGQELMHLQGIGKHAMQVIMNFIEKNKLSLNNKDSSTGSVAKGARSAGVIGEKETTGPNTIDAYINQFPPEVQVILQELRTVIKAAAPDAEEKISYQMPAFVLKGNLVYFAAYKNHIGFYPTASGIEAFKPELAVYKGAKGSVQFPLNKPLPFKLISKIVEYRVIENLEKAALTAEHK